MDIAPEVDVVRHYVDLKLDEMMSILKDLGDDRVNLRPALEGANSPYAIVTHCLGVMEFWGGQVVAGREIQRDRPAEFVAQGTVAEIAAKVDKAKEQFRADLAEARFNTQLQQPAERPYRGLPGPEPTQGNVLLHVLEELAQHLGHIEITRDILVAHPAE